MRGMIDRLVMRWRWRRRYLPRLPAQFRSSQPTGYGQHALRTGVPPLLLGLVVAATVVVGIWLGGKVAESSARSSAELASLAQALSRKQPPILERVISRLSSERVNRRRALSLDGDSSAQAVAARSVSDAYRTAERALSRADRQRFRAVIVAMRQAARGYDELAAAARRHDGTAYARAAAAVSAAEGALQRLISAGTSA